MTYSTNADIDSIFGPVNVNKWADLDNEGNNELINARKVWARELAEDWINTRLKDGPYTIPLTGDSGTFDKVIVDLEARMAGVFLYDARRIIDTDPEETDEVNVHRKMVESTISQIQGGRLRLLKESGKKVCYPVNL